MVYVLCKEDTRQLFFTCKVSREIWNQIIMKLKKKKNMAEHMEKIIFLEEKRPEQNLKKDLVNLHVVC